MTKGLVDTGSAPAFKVGTVVEFTADEMRTLAGAAVQMEYLTRQGATGWLLPYVQAHRASQRVLNAAFKRAHSGPT